MARRPRADSPGIAKSRTVPLDQRASGYIMPGQTAPVPLSPERIAERYQFIESLLLSGMTNSRVIAACVQPYAKDENGLLMGLGIGPDQVVPICTEIRKRWQDDYKAREATRRTDQLACLQNDLARMRSQSTVPWSTVGVHEKLKAEIEGNLAPRRLEVGVHAIPDALGVALAGMTEADVEALIAEELELTKKAQAIVTTAEASPSP